MPPAVAPDRFPRRIHSCSAAFYSGFFFHWTGVRDLFVAYLPWFKTGSEGHGHEKSWYYWLALWAIINTVVSFYYYFRFIKVMYLGDRLADNKPLALSPALQTALAVSVIGVLAVGIYPQPIIKVTQDLVKQLIR